MHPHTYIHTYIHTQCMDTHMCKSRHTLTHTRAHTHTYICIQTLNFTIINELVCGEKLNNTLVSCRAGKVEKKCILFSACILLMVPTLVFVRKILGLFCEATYYNTHPHVVPRLRMSRSYTSSPPKHLHGV
jgi:hypothetical protein